MFQTEVHHRLPYTADIKPQFEMFCTELSYAKQQLNVIRIMLWPNIVLVNFRLDKLFLFLLLLLFSSNCILAGNLSSPKREPIKTKMW